MSEDNEFTELIRRVRTGDEEAASQLVTRYEPYIRRVARTRLHHQRGVVDTSDISQTVLKSFFFRLRLGQYDLTTADDLVKLLSTMVRNKIVTKNRKEQAARRDHRRNASGDVSELPVPGPTNTPSEIVAERELIEEALRRLSPEENQLNELRNEGLEWSEIASRLGGTAEGRRKQLARALDRIAVELEVDE